MKTIYWKEAAKLFRVEGPNLVWVYDVRGRHRAGYVAGTIRTDGYVYVSWKHGGNTRGSRTYGAHRIIYALGNQVDLLEGQIDHINGIRDDNRIENLRLVSNRDNSLNQKRSRLNTTGRTGVVFRDRLPKRKWVARITVEGKSIYLGAYQCYGEAVAARKEAELKYGFHENHDRVMDVIYKD
tara:strand:+ start:5561 stop:6106 length:546 start_codon:yes stop_codon:yes gene_type:complete